MRKKKKDLQGPGEQLERDRKAGPAEEGERVDEANDESFPASDPPPWTGAVPSAPSEANPPPKSAGGPP